MTDANGTTDATTATDAPDAAATDGAAAFLERRLAAVRACDRVLSGAPLPTMREQLAALRALDGLDERPDLYGDGPLRLLEERVAALLGTEDAVFFPTGTMAQQVALRYGAERSGSSAVALHPLAHLERWERQAYSQLTGLRGLWPTAEPRHFTAAELTDLGEPFGTMTVELPLRDAGFLLPSWAELVELTDAARAAGARVHFDGARLWESTEHLGKGLDEIAALADSVYVSFYKTLGGLSGAALAGDGALAGYARAWRHRHGGNVFQQWPAALAALDGLERVLPRVPQHVRHAQVVAAALAELPGARINPAAPHTHQFRLWLPHPAAALNEAALTLADQERTWFVGGWQDGAPGLAMAEVTVGAAALGWSAAEVAEAGRRFLALLPA
ncbi:threonine aldolase family protein [Kitasatospora sp. NBC_01287]|uniref:threonine aldolase family protein n=1 Tax=Kitasatospora sp. NBC_01287 TaxID=2903573 RepID=UPI00224F9ABB|nr:beta-eliminating lyase-related protein [Kitasatospora sp. NBC_01287]MCX4749383.1 threonine aldolase family protein [Kitasatospora sp. NBC_01287]